MRALAAEKAGAGSLLAYGNGRSYGDSCQNSSGAIVDMRARDGLIELNAETGVLEAEAGMMLGAYLNGWKSRKTAAEGDLSVLDAEEAGARDALTGAFEELKKFEHVAETTRLNQLIALAKRETADFDELGLRKRAV